MPATQPEWEERYQQGDTPWDSGIRSRELARVLNDGSVKPCRAVDIGCGTGTNAVFLAEQGFQVTAFDYSPLALEQAQQRAAEAAVTVEFLEADLGDLQAEIEPFDFVFDRGCYHCVRKTNLPGILRTLERLTKAGSQYLVLTGNANEPREQGPPALREQEIRDDLEPLFEIAFIREIHFEDADGLEGPLGWSCLMTRRANA